MIEAKYFLSLQIKSSIISLSLLKSIILKSLIKGFAKFKLNFTVDDFSLIIFIHDNSFCTVKGVFSFLSKILIIILISNVTNIKKLSISSI